MSAPLFGPGRVSLVGAGPGDPELITLKAARRLAEADVVLADALANRALLAHCAADARVVDVGKLAGRRSVPQPVTTALLVEEARAGHRVVRLKGGDPFVFGRGGEEMLALAEAGVPFEVVPGIASPIGAVASAHVPVTHRGLSTHFSVVTGTAVDEAGIEEQWGHLGRAGGTLVFLMALRPLPRICEKLLAAGLDPATPAAMIQGGTRADERVVDGTVRDLPARVATAGLASPALLVVGRVLEVRHDVLAFLSSPAFAPSPLSPLPA